MELDDVCFCSYPFYDSSFRHQREIIEKCFYTIII
jgi:hypothetical protein